MHWDSYGPMRMATAGRLSGHIGCVDIAASDIAGQCSAVNHDMAKTTPQYDHQAVEESRKGADSDHEAPVHFNNPFLTPIGFKADGVLARVIQPALDASLA